MLRLTVNNNLKSKEIPLPPTISGAGKDKFYTLAANSLTPLWCQAFYDYP